MTANGFYRTLGTIGDLVSHYHLKGALGCFMIAPFEARPGYISKCLYGDILMALSGKNSFVFSHHKFMMRLLAALWVGFGINLATLAMAHAQIADSQIADRMTADEIEAALSDAGFEVTMSTDADSGNPVAKGVTGNIIFIVRAMDCEGSPKACQQLMLFANFDLGREATERDFRVVNDFNDSSLDGRAYVLERTNQVGIDFVIDLTGGVSPDHIAGRLARWEGVISRFLEEFRAGQTGS